MYLEDDIAKKFNLVPSNSKNILSYKSWALKLNGF